MTSDMVKGSKPILQPIKRFKEYGMTTKLCLYNILEKCTRKLWTMPKSSVLLSWTNLKMEKLLLLMLQTRWGTSTSQTLSWATVDLNSSRWCRRTILYQQRMRKISLTRYRIWTGLVNTTQDSKVPYRARQTSKRKLNTLVQGKSNLNTKNLLVQLRTHRKNTILTFEF